MRTTPEEGRLKREGAVCGGGGLLICKGIKLKSGSAAARAGSL